jgi:hypothetical protein
VLAEVDCQADPDLPWTGQITALAYRLRTVLEDHPGIAALLKTRDPSAPTPSPWPRRSSPRCTPPACPVPRAVSAGNWLAGRERRKACSSPLVAVSWRRCSPGEVGSLSAKPMM